jgi:hypothetical protein
MGDLAGKLLLAGIAFLLGLLADVIKKAFGRERKRITYSINKEPIIVVSQSLPGEVLEKLPTRLALNVVQYRVVCENTGTQPIKDVNLLLSANADAELLHHEMSTIPAREVPFPAVETPTSNQIRFVGMQLERKQRIDFKLFFRSLSEPNVEDFPSGGDNVEWKRSGAAEEFSLEEHIVAIIRNYVLAEFMPALFLGIAYLLGSIVAISAFRNNSAILSGSIGLAQTLASLVRFYFYLRIIPHAVAVIRDLIQRRPSLRTGGTVNGP